LLIFTKPTTQTPDPFKQKKLTTIAIAHLECGTLKVDCPLNVGPTST